ncbi:hypothetical protein C8Q70DRAFT_925573 [Cubamyces menziesii]|nr:hypothetical protein C8Q70DRAFT_925573 [Cubamyces menziesii]
MSIASADELGSDSVVEPASEKVSVDSEGKDGSNSESEGKADSVRDSDDDDKDEDRLDHVLGLLSSKENSVDDEDEWERDMYRKVWRFLEVRNPGSTLTKAGPCTIMTGTSLELQNPDPGVISKTFLLRDAKLFNRAGGCQGHVIVKVVPYSASNCMRFEQLEDDTLREVSSTLLTMHGWLEGYTIPFLIDMGSQIDCINANIWRTIGWAHPLTRRAERLLNVTGSRLRCLGVWKAFVTIGTITSMVDLHVVEGLMEAGILGRPWQELNQMSLNDTDEGVYLSIRSGNGFHTYGILVTSPEAQRAVRRRAREICAVVARPSTPEMSFDESHQLCELFKAPVDLPLEPSPEYDPWDLKVDDDTGTLEPEHEISEANLENQMYTRLLWQYCNGHRLPRAVSQPTIESIEVYESDKLELRDDWLIGISKKEQLFILRNVLVRIDGKYREGHGVLHMVYFPHESERARIANAALKGDGDTERNGTDEELEEEQRGRRVGGGTARSKTLWTTDVAQVHTGRPVSVDE